MPQQTKPLMDDSPGLASPLGVAMSQGDRQVMTMVAEAIRTRRLLLAYQPVVLSSDPRRIAFHEGLIRVLDPTGRIIPARDFMAEVEVHELGREIDCAALELGLATLVQHPHLRISLNMSARSIGYPRWTQILRLGLDQGATVGERLILEISETSTMLVPELVIRFMEDMQGRNVAFALDNFGAGQTAIRYFKDFMFDMLKIDGQFIRDIHRNPDNRALAKALLAIARHFDMFTVAEAVETPEDAECLRTLGVDCQQGYLFGAPTVKPVWLNSAMAQTG
ncbi:MAG: EAL domain-containing protein [Paracoccaceae bacterium]